MCAKKQDQTLGRREKFFSRQYVTFFKTNHFKTIFTFAKGGLGADNAVPVPELVGLPCTVASVSAAPSPPPKKPSSIPGFDPV